MTDTLIRQSGQSLLGIYLNDHFAGATAGIPLARRVAGCHQTRPRVTRSDAWRQKSQKIVLRC